MVTAPNSTCWRFTGLYGNPDTSLRPQFWNLLKRLGDSVSLPWLCGGDLNEILFGHEKQGGAERAQYLMNHFREAINHCGLADLGFRGPKFTWNRGNGVCLVQERLDRMLGNSTWVKLFPNSLVHHLNLRGSDHRPLLVELLQADERSIFGKTWKKGRFHFEEAWADEEECSNIIKRHWNSSPSTNLDGVSHKLRLCATDLEGWNMECFSRLKMQVRKAKTAFERIDKNLSDHNWKEHQRLQKALDALRYKEERYWRQRSKDLWLKCGDRNSKFFHQKASARNEEGMAHIIENYFDTLFSSTSPSPVDFDRVTDSIKSRVTPQMNEQLEQVFVADDVKTAVFQMAPTKSPGADGMSAIFYQKFWPIVGEDVTAACLGFTNGGLSLGTINETIITLLPKTKNPTRITEFRPIKQSAFIPGRLISDNAIIGFECLHAIKRRKSKKNYLALKLDMAKAYDRVEWDFIQRILNKLGFSEVWIRKLMACISSVTYSFQFNGDPLSPYLFLLCGEGLSSLLHRYEQSGDLQGLRCGLRGPTISHLLFADDSLFFLEAQLATCTNLKEILKLYETASGQVVNLSKSAVNKQGLFSSIKDRVWNKLYQTEELKLFSWLDFWVTYSGTFNKAILAKQAWRIHSQPTSLAARVLQGFYFHRSSFLQVKVNSSSSFMWRSILWGRELYKQGLRCKIGSGQNTYIYHDCWLPRDGIFRISSPRVLGEFAKVSSLITASGSWDSSIIRESFHEDEAEAILSLPLPRRSTPDTLLWHYDKSGHYTVRSGYWLANKGRSVPSSSTVSLNSWWKRLWRLRVPAKIRIFIWKAFYNWIPSSVNLANHGVPSQKRCLICNEANDTTLHALWGCKVLDPLKEMCDSFINFKIPPQCDLKEFLLSANDGLSLDRLEFLCILLWRIWFRRNKWIHEHIWLDDESCYSWARLYHADFLEANCRKGEPPKKAVASPWQAPEVGFVKVNTDAAWCSNKKKFGLGSVIRDYSGKVLGSVAMPISSSVSVAVAESWALEKGASLARQMGFSAVILESDCLGVTNALDTKIVHDSDLSYVFDSIYEICNGFDMFKFSYTPRTGNQVAHSLARLALSLENVQIWPSGVPESLLPIVIADIQHVSSS
ncbi:hypothetical protein UlMin_028993 [Ulmus minor]